MICSAKMIHSFCFQAPFLVDVGGEFQRFGRINFNNISIDFGVLTVSDILIVALRRQWNQTVISFAANIAVGRFTSE